MPEMLKAATIGAKLCAASYIEANYEANDGDELSLDGYEGDPGHAAYKDLVGTESYKIVHSFEYVVQKPIC